MSKFSANNDAIANFRLAEGTAWQRQAVHEAEGGAKRRPTTRASGTLSAEAAIGGAFKELISMWSQSDMFLPAKARSVRVDGNRPTGLRNNLFDLLE